MKKCPVCGVKIKNSSNACKKHCKSEKEIERVKKMMAELTKKHSKENHYRWKGDLVGYSALHKWLRKTFGKPDRCENPKCSGKSNVYEWANVTGIYNRDIKNYKKLCKSCHIKIDRWGYEIGKEL